MLRGGRDDDDYFNLALQTHNKYYQYSDVRKQVFRELILAYGTEACVEEANEKDLTKMQDTMRAYLFVNLLAYIEIREKNQGTFDTHSDIEFLKQFCATFHCPRETIRFFHRRNSCDCLHGIYYKLKDTTKRTFGCWNCHQLVDVKKALHCKCELVKYCSKQCVLENYSNHKDFCNIIREGVQKYWY
jgi:hypothetical protein